MATASQSQGQGQGDNFFEGTEKLLEVWFASKSTGNGTDGDLRKIKREEWEKLLTLVKCEIISFIQNKDMDAFLLSESSMFVTKDRFILKTCGKTTLLAAVSPLVELVKRECGFDLVKDIFYSRKNFIRPELQHSVHQSFDKEVSVLDNMFSNGSAYVLGRMNKDCWYLYTLDNEGVLLPDQTLELLMWDMCQTEMNIFTTAISKDGKDASQKSGISKLFPDMKMDDFLFEPCGYSMNGILEDGCYMTIHVTPEPHCSYVSFETNMPQESYKNLINRILKTFNPSKFLVTIFANTASVARDSHKELQAVDFVKGFKQHDHQLCSFKNYNLTYSQFSKSNKE